jgi:hypothetical protein
MARRQFTLGAALALSLAALLRIRPPSGFPFYPPCLFREWTGLACPGCGATHALAALLAGRVAEAAHCNLLLLLLAPAAVALAVQQGYSAWRWNRWRPLPLAPRAVAVLAGAVVVFGVARNFAPHWLGPQ